MEKRHINRNRRLAAAAVAAMAMSGLAYNANAALTVELTLDGSGPGAGKAVTNTTVGNAITLDVWATVTGTINSATINQALDSVQLSMIGTGTAGSSIAGNYALSGTSPQAPWNGNGSSSVAGGFPAGTFTDANGDTAIGSTNNADATGWWIARTGTTQGQSSTTSASFMLGKLTFTPTALNSSTALDLKPVFRNAQNAALWFEDGTSAAGTGGGAPPQYYGNKDFLSGVTSIGADVVLTAGVVGPANSEWIHTSDGGTWTTPGNWSGGQVPGVVTAVPGAAGGDIANFLSTGDASGTRAVTLDANETVGGIVFNPTVGAGYTISGAQTITLNNGTPANPTITSTAGTNTISSAVKLTQNATVNVASVSSLAMTNFAANGKSVSSTGAGSLTVNRVGGESGVVAGALSVTGGGQVHVAQGGGTAGTSVVTSVAVSGTGSKLDLGDHKMIVSGGAANVAAVNALVKSAAATVAGGHNPTFTGDGITTTAPLVPGDTHLRAIGVAVNGVIGNVQTSFSGQSSTGSDLLVGYTLAGDGNMDGAVTFADFQLLQNNFNGSGKLWQDGDYNYDGLVNFFDFQTLQNNFNVNIGTAAPPLDGGLAGVSAVPEPASLGLLGIAGLAMVRRRRRA